MDEFDFINEKQPRRFRFGAALWNLISTLVFLATLAVGAASSLIFADPQSEFNPFPPALTQTVQPEASATAEATATATIEASPPPTSTNTPLPSPTPTTVPPSPTPTRAPGSYFRIQEGSPATLDASVFHPDLGCKFFGVAGQAFGLDDAPIPGLRVQITGTLNGQAVDKLGLTGAATQYGTGSYYEIRLGDTPIASQNSLNIVLRDAGGQAISDPLAFSTTANCSQNLILINFRALP